jgi:hypothetical protein
MRVAVQPKPKRRIRKILFRALLVAVGVAAAAQLAYTFSGSGKWQYLGAHDGVTVYSMKEPGENLQKFTAVVRVKSSLSRLVAFMEDTDTDINSAFYKVRLLRRDSPRVFINTWRSAFSAPFTDRDFVVRHTFTQDPKTRQVTWEVEGLPDFIPRDSCCVRVSRMENSWQLIPLKNGEVEIRWLIDMDVGGWAPYFVINHAHPALMYDLASKIQEQVELDKYANAKIDWLVEPQS